LELPREKTNLLESKQEKFGGLELTKRTEGTLLKIRTFHKNLVSSLMKLALHIKDRKGHGAENIA
jgi:hypothetical protein